MKITVMKVGAKWCGPCAALAKRGTLEKFAASHPEVRLEIHDDSEDGNKRWESFADKWNVANLPTLIWTAGGVELFRSEDVSAAGIEKQLKRAVKLLESR